MAILDPATDRSNTWEAPFATRCPSTARVRWLAFKNVNSFPPFYLPKYKFGNHKATWGNSMTTARPTIITSTKGTIER
jgi:hypothetical protein